LSCKSKAAVFTDFCSSEVCRDRLSVKVSAMRNCMEEALLVYVMGYGRAAPPSAEAVELKFHAD